MRKGKSVLSNVRVEADEKEKCLLVGRKKKESLLKERESVLKEKEKEISDRERRVQEKERKDRNSQTRLRSYRKKESMVELKFK